MKKLILLLCCCLAAACSPNKQEKAVPHIPILGWYSIPPGEHATLEHYREMREAGFDFSFAHIYSYEDAIQALDLCAQVGMKSIFMCPELKTAPEETVDKVMNHPGLGGYFLCDEPGNDSLDAIGEWASRIYSVDSIHPCYLNLLPVHAFGHDAYVEHLELFNKKVHLPQLSFDYYPVLIGPDHCLLSPYWYDNLELISAECRRTGKPFWAFALATAHGPYPIPTIDHLRLQMYSNLAYGAQLLQYFTYWNPGTEQWDFHQAPITIDGHRSPVYELVRQINEEIQKRAFVWDGCTVKRVSHIAETVPVGTHPLTQLPSHFTKIQSEKGCGLVSEIKNGNRHFVMFVNTSPAEEWRVQIQTDDCVQLVRLDGTSVPAQAYDQLFILTPGNCDIFEVK